VRALRTLALLDVESHPPSAAIDTVTIIIEPTPGRILQHTLFSRPHPTPEQLSTLLARLGALMGQDRIGAPATVDSFRPGAFALTPFAIDQSAVSNQSAICSQQSAIHVSALRRCRQPIPARVATDAHQRPLRVSTERRGFAGGAVLSCAGPWRTSGAWWEEEREVGSQKLEVRSQKSEVRNDNSEVRNEKSEVRSQSSSTDVVEVGGQGAGHPVVEAGFRPRRGPAAPPRREPNQLHERAKAGPWSRDEWDVALADGAVYRIFRDRVTDAWFIDGVVD
jgi:hypothetical protein